jgi:glutamate dehydrogenase (NAD(P)+)
MNSAREFQKEFASLQEYFKSMRPEMALTVADPTLDVDGYVVVWNTKISEGGPLEGAGKGGTRCEATLDLEQVVRLASTMALKNAATGLPVGGAKSGVRMDKNDPDYERKWRRFVEMTAPMLHERGGCFGGYGYDKGCHIPDNAIWAVDELMTKKIGSERSVTGKPVEMGGTDYDREGIAGLGVAAAAQVLLETYGKPVNGARFAVQGMGAMGAGIYHYFTQYGGQLTALSDLLFGGTWVFEAVLPEALGCALACREFETAKRLLPLTGKKISEDVSEVLYQRVDVLFPAATEDQITADNAWKIAAPFLAEGANNPTSNEAYDLLFKNETIVVPDIIANPGGIIAAFVEITTPTTPEIIRSRGKINIAKDLTIKKVTENTRLLLDTVTRLGVRPDQVAFLMACRNIKHGLPQLK